MRRILEIDPVNRLAIVEPGLPNIQLSEAAAEHGLFYAPDPSSQKACTIGGNIAENAGGPHCLALGVTTNHVLGIEVVTADGHVVWLGARWRTVSDTTCAVRSWAARERLASPPRSWCGCCQCRRRS